MAEDEKRGSGDRRPADYAVGYGKPPLHSRFRKGHTGHRPGRPRRTKDLAALLSEALDRPAAAPAPRPATHREAIAARLVADAAEGDLRATRLLFELVRQAGPAAAAGAADEEDPRAALLRHLARLAAANPADGEPDPA